jgi:hypothetical protein
LKQSHVRFETGRYHVGRAVQYVRLGIQVEVEKSTLRAFVVTVKHANGAKPREIVAAARDVLREFLLLMQLGTGSDNLFAAHPTIVESGWEEMLIFGDGGPYLRFRPLICTPPEALLQLVGADIVLRRQTEFLVDSRSFAASHPSTRVSLAYQVLELEESRSTGYKAPFWARALRHAVSHPRLDDPKVRAYLKRRIGSSELNLQDAAHRAFVKRGAARIINEASRIVDVQIGTMRFWHSGRRPTCSWSS